MTSARYGRMKVGQCLTRGHHVGCSADVINFMDRKCSGRHSCELPIPDYTLQNIQPCPKDLMAYLDATYQCVKVATARNQYCLQGEKVKLHGASKGYLASKISETYGVGTPNCPWEIKVAQGQRINITLFDFNLPPVTQAGDVCQVYAIIKEGKSGADVTVCGGDKRHKSVYVSESNSVEVQIMGASEGQDPVHFLLQYEAIGCPDLRPPNGGWVKRTGNKVMVSCNKTGEVRHLVCNGTSWVGDVNNCSGGGKSSTNGMAELLGTSKAFPFGLLIAIIIGIVLGIVLGIVMLTVVMHVWRRKHRKQTLKGSIFLTSSSQGNNNRSAAAALLEKRPGEVVHTSEYGYAHVWELQHLKANPDITSDFKSATSTMDYTTKHHDCHTLDRATLASLGHSCAHNRGDHIVHKVPLESTGDIYPMDLPMTITTDTPFYHEFETNCDTTVAKI